MNLTTIALPFIAAFTGWITNWIAVKMLFHPKRPIKILFIEIQGVFPKRQQKMAESLGEIVARELFSFEDIKEKMFSEKNLAEINQFLGQKIDDFLRNKLKKTIPMISIFMSQSLIDKIKNSLIAEFDTSFPQILETYAHNLENDIDVRKIVYDKVIQFSSDKLETLLYAIMSKEFFFIEIIGGVLGFIIGIIQVILVSI
jgi:uncharacterized membrane protein YheB (UPF0754 family)